MTISYKWLSEYLPVTIDPEKLSHILTSIGLEVESMQPYEEVKGALQALVIGEVLTTEKHPNADKLTLTTVHIGGQQPLHIVCGAPNVAAGQKVVVAPVGATIYPSTGEPLTMSQRKIRGSESQGMICSEDEIGLGTSHEGILVLPADVKVGMPAAEYFNPYSDIIYEVGLTPNRMDAMSHWGVARDVCAYLSHHEKKELKAQLPTTHHFKIDSTALTLQVEVENTNACQRYSGISLSNITVAPSPKWLKEKIKAIGLRPINNLVDITNYLQHETGQPLHVFDADKISGKKIIVRNLAAGTLFKTLDEKERTLSGDDLMICDDTQGLCIAGVFGGLESGVTDATKNIFLESAYFDGITLRKTSFRHGLRTDAATRFEKGTDISNTVEVLKRAAILIKELAGGEIASNIIDVYPAPKPKAEVAIKWSYIKKLSGKLYHPTAIANLLTSLGFDIINTDDDALKVAVPYHKPDISLPADIVEEIVRIDGLDNIEIPQSISITPSVDDHYATELYREKTANYLAGLGFNEMMTNSITNAAYYTPEEQQSMVKMTNSLSAELNILRPSLFETALEVVAHNLNHKNNSLRLFEFGKAYSTTGGTKYQEEEKLCIVISGNKTEDNWKQKAIAADFYLLKGTIYGVLACLGIQADTIEPVPSPKYENHIVYKLNNDVIASAGEVSKLTREKFGIKQPVYFANLHWQLLAPLAVGHTPVVKEIAKYPAVQRDLAIVIDKSLTWNQVLQTIHKTKLLTLQDVKLFDIFESEKLGSGKKSVAINFTFLDEAKTLTDKEIDGWMSKIVTVLQKEIQAEIRK
ncbi:MAG: hypothetical protein RL115_1433 [Bacteroidota bacterium]